MNFNQIGAVASGLLYVAVCWPGTAHSIVAPCEPEFLLLSPVTDAHPANQPIIFGALSPSGCPSRDFEGYDGRALLEDEQGAVLDGELTWITDNIARFAPDQPLEQGSAYTFSLFYDFEILSAQTTFTASEPVEPPPLELHDIVSIEAFTHVIEETIPNQDGEPTSRFAVRALVRMNLAQIRQEAVAHEFAFIGGERAQIIPASNQTELEARVTLLPYSVDLGRAQFEATQEVCFTLAEVLDYGVDVGAEEFCEPPTVLSSDSNNPPDPESQDDTNGQGADNASIDDENTAGCHTAEQHRPIIPTTPLLLLMGAAGLIALRPRP